MERGNTETQVGHDDDDVGLRFRFRADGGSSCVSRETSRERGSTQPRFCFSRASTESTQGQLGGMWFFVLGLSKVTYTTPDQLF